MDHSRPDFGGMIWAGVQKYAFVHSGAVYLCYDLTDNKTLLTMLVWLIALWKDGAAGPPHLEIVAAVVLLLVFRLPHSVMGLN